MSGGVEIFPMQRADLATVTVLAKQLGYNVTEPELSYRFDSFFESASETLFVAKKNHQVVGWIHILTVPASLLMGSRAEVHALVVDESFRNHGIGKKLLMKGEHWAQQKGFKSVRLRSNVIREDAKKFYLRQGYTILKTQNTFEKII
jgi:ribosomal protein S18 acetylase RimI-like enzyme